MIILLHGENQSASRRVLSEKISLFQTKGFEIIRITGSKIELAEFKQACESKSLFREKKLLVIENFFTQPKSKQKNEIQSYFQSLPSQLDIIFWEGKAMTPTQLRKLPPNTKVYLFKV
jgi:DNA polymerase III delta subunit